MQQKENEKKKLSDRKNIKKRRKKTEYVKMERKGDEIRQEKDKREIFTLMKKNCAGK